MIVDTIYFHQVVQNISIALSSVKDALIQKIKEIRDRILCAYQEPSKHVPKLDLPPHSMPNMYPKRYKNMDWPRYLDNARGVCYGGFANPNDLEGIAGLQEPLEMVTPLHAVSLGDNKKGAFRLIADGGGIESKDIRGQTPAYWASYCGNLEMLTRFKIYGVDLNCKDYRGKTPLRAAVKYGHEKIIAFLASHKVNLNELDGRGLTSLHLAAFHGRFSVYEQLIYCGADRTIKDPLGRTAEDVLKMKYAELYHNRWFIGRLFSSPIPPPLSLGPWKVENLRDKRQMNL